MLSIIVTPLPKEKRGIFSYYSNGIRINGVFDEKAHVGGGLILSSDKRPTIDLYSKEAIGELYESSFQELAKYVSTCSFSEESGEFGFRVNIDLSSKAGLNRIAPAVTVSVVTNSNNWTKPYSIIQLVHKMKALSEQELKPEADFFSRFVLVTPEFGTELGIHDFNQKVKSVVKRVQAYTHDLVKRAIALLMAEVEDDVVTTFFQFPPEIKTAAKQYLVYFAQFLLDIGIDADTEIREELHETLFKIIPKDKGESLERIKEALEIFLNMPGMPNMDAEIAKSGDIAAMQLQANIHHLKGQMMLMQAAVQMKDATIESLQLTNYQLKEIVERKEAESKKSEDLIPGVVSVSKFEKGGLSISWAELLRRLKRKF